MPERSALVLGSTQARSDVNDEQAHRMGVDIVRRSSGGGAVLVEPDDVLWLDVVLPAGDQLWQVDVGKAFWWLGDVLAAALHRTSGIDADVHRAALVTTPWSRKVCFAGRGPGEVVVGDRKVVGISQRRVRAGALFQCAIIRRFDIDRLASLLVLNAGETADLRRSLEGSVMELPDLQLDELRRALESFLPQ